MTDHQHAADVLNRAADHIAAHGHMRGAGHGDGPIHSAPACLIGAINLAVDGAPSREAVDLVHDYLGGSIVLWNDAPERTATEVIEVLRAAAAIEQAKHDAAHLPAEVTA